jgi:hypothetical protein
MPLPVPAPLLPEPIPPLPVMAPVLPVPVVAPPPLDAPELWPLVPVPPAHPTEAARLTAATTPNSGRTFDRIECSGCSLVLFSGEKTDFSIRISEVNARFSTFRET